MIISANSGMATLFKYLSSCSKGVSIQDDSLLLSPSAKTPAEGLRL